MDYTAKDPAYGTMQDFENLISEVDKRNIKIVMDLVFNHTSNQHEWFLESKKSRDNPKSDWYIWRDKPTNWRGIFGGSAWEWCEERQQYYLHTFAVEQPDLNWENPEVRKALFDAANFWVKKGIGGFRIDAITYIKKPEKFIDGKVDGPDGLSSIHEITANSPGILDFLREFKREVFDGKNIFTVGEANGVPVDELQYWSGENGVFNMIFEFTVTRMPFKHGEFWYKPEKWTIKDFKNALNATQQATKTTWCPVFFENHDEPRSVNHYFPDVNLQGAEREKAAKALSVILLTLRGTPFIYQGEEIGSNNIDWNDINIYNDISSRGQYEIARKKGLSHDEAMKGVKFFSRDNARTPMQWNSKINAGFTGENAKSWLPLNDSYKIINVEAQENNNNSVLNFYRELSKFRRENEALLSGEYDYLMPEDENIFAYSRSIGNEKFLIAVNLSLNKSEIPKEIFNDKKIIIDTQPENKNNLLLLPLEARIYK